MWNKLIEAEMKKDYFKNLDLFLEQELKKYTIYPSKENWFKAFEETPYEKVKVVIIGQDPYHGENEAHGLAFSSLSDKRPPSLKNIFEELKSDLNVEIPKTNNLTDWANQGVLLLNTVLTVRKDEANSHKNQGWETFTQNMIASLHKKDYLVYILWGKQAQAYEKWITNKNSLIIKSAHPSPLSVYRGFIGSKPFSKTNEYLMKNKISIIDWHLEK
ncbi:Uracil-DNA glycosylase [Alteracholeplasma palmae J233]|uniref:Uracil-DNA glycosylase n=2 Tax=Acholeplasma palmae TaxID=38986 RepID=U4KNR2_ALTPJ|nr:uracil-DNA glycosylase [Alteracholeplasma palmae]CCV63845.1 Uracil-DNA glycosylase [Alteracholeplasma palmae J233]